MTDSSAMEQRIMSTIRQQQISVGEFCSNRGDTRVYGIVLYIACTDWRWRREPIRVL